MIPLAVYSLVVLVPAIVDGVRWVPQETLAAAAAMAAPAGRYAATSRCSCRWPARRRRGPAADIFTTDPAIDKEGFVVLKDPENFFGFADVHPLVREGDLSEKAVAASVLQLASSTPRPSGDLDSQVQTDEDLDVGEGVARWRAWSDQPPARRPGRPRPRSAGRRGRSARPGRRPAPGRRTAPRPPAPAAPAPDGSPRADTGAVVEAVDAHRPDLAARRSRWRRNCSSGRRTSSSTTAPSAPTAIVGIEPEPLLARGAEQVQHQVPADGDPAEVQRHRGGPLLLDPGEVVHAQPRHGERVLRIAQGDALSPTEHGGLPAPKRQGDGVSGRVGCRRGGVLRAGQGPPSLSAAGPGPGRTAWDAAHGR
ncbi:hypothetical protein SFUMM280S_00442 [Streptomyces fumanus]